MEVCNYVMLSKILSSKYNYSTQIKKLLNI